MRKANAIEKNRQKTAGAFYTPPFIAAYLTRQTLAPVLKHIPADQLRLIDPACGDGVFLIEALKQLRETFPHVSPASLSTCLFGIDSDPVAVSKCRSRLAKATSLPPEAFRETIQCADTLLDATVFDETPWDAVLGNPPYMSEVRNLSGLFAKLKHAGGYYHAKMDLADAFTAKSVERLKPGGRLGFVLPEYWLQRHSARPLRRKIWTETRIEELWLYGAEKPFREAPGHHTSLLVLEKNRQPDQSGVRSIRLGQGQHHQPPDRDSLIKAGLSFQPGSGRLLIGQTDELAILEAMTATGNSIPAQWIQQGIVLPQGRLRHKDRQKLPADLADTLPEDAGIFLLTPGEVAALNLSEAEQTLLKPYYLPGDFQPEQGFQQPARYYLLYLDRKNRQCLHDFPERYPNIRQHLNRLAPVITSSNGPYGLHRPRQPEWFEGGTRLYGLRQTPKPCFAVATEPAYVNEGFYILRPQAPWTPEALGRLLNSKLAWFWFYHQKRKGHQLQIDKDVLSVFPLPPLTPKQAGAVASAPLAEILALYNLPEIAGKTIDRKWQEIAGGGF